MSKASTKNCLGISYQQFKQKAEKEIIVSNYCEIFADLDTPVSLYAKLRKKSNQAFLFESVVGGENIGRYSLIGYKALETLAQGSYDELAAEISRYASKDELPFFHKGFVGFFSFESFASIEKKLEIKQKDFSEDSKQIAELPEMYMLLVGTLLVFDKVKNKIFLISNQKLSSKDEAVIKTAYEKSENELAELLEIIDDNNDLSRLNIDFEQDVDFKGDFKSNTGFENFAKMVRVAKERILEGDIFQVVLSHRLSAEISLDPLNLYRVLRSMNPSPYLFIYNVETKSGTQTLLGSSPEMLVKSQRVQIADGKDEFHAEIRPIAGTYPRGKTIAEDEKNAAMLLADEKERAEHVMLIDLARNDLGRVAKAGSVELAQNMLIENYSHVMHIVSSVIAKLEAGKNIQEDSRVGVDLLKACFPAGTLSGAPKCEAIEIINELELEPRGPYGGTIGYFSLDGSMDSAIMIRTILLQKNKLFIQAGAGIVADSQEESEFQETYNKASALMKVVKLAS